MAALNVKWPPIFRESEQQATWTLFVFGIVFNNPAPIPDGLLQFNDTDATNDSLVDGMFRERLARPEPKPKFEKRDCH